MGIGCLQWRPVKDKPAETAPDAFSLDLFQRILTDEIKILIEINKLAQPHFKRIGMIIRIGVDRHKTAFNTFDIIRSTGADPVRGTCLGNDIPERITATAITQEQLKATLLAPARTAQDNRNTVQFGIDKAEILDVTDMVTEQVTDNVDAFGP